VQEEAPRIGKENQHIRKRPKRLMNSNEIEGKNAREGKEA